MNDMAELVATYESGDLLGRFFSEFLDEAAFAEFRKIERLFDALREHGQTVSGYPIIRPTDCAKITELLTDIFEESKAQFRTREPQITERFEQLIAEFHAFCQRIYPSEATAALVLHGKVLLFMGRTERVLELVSHLATRPYAVENSLRNCMELVELYAQAHLRQGTISQLPISFIAFGAWLASSPSGPSKFAVAMRMAPYVNCEGSGRGAPIRSYLIRRASSGYLRATRGQGRWYKIAVAFLAAQLCRIFLTACYASLAKTARFRAPFSLQMNKEGAVLVTRAMGGIGDMLMMEPGLEALAKVQGQPVDFAIPKRFFPVFANNPHVRLIDIEGSAIDVSNYREFVNLSICPAGDYESRTRPDVKLGRVEIFARAMGIQKKALRRQGWRINHFISEEEKAQSEKFLVSHGLGQRPIIGVQPYSRDSYKDHPAITSIIGALAQDYDVVIFHHIADGLPDGPGIASTAGLPLSTSLALVPHLKAMVSVDSAFLHAAAAHDVPVIALFGPTDARTFTRHHRQVTILWKPREFGCVPCWRNEDMICRVTRQRSMSPCIAAITAAEVHKAVTDAIGATPR